MSFEDYVKILLGMQVLYQVVIMFTLFEIRNIMKMRK